MAAFLPSLVFFVLAPLSVNLALWLAFAGAFAIGLRGFGATHQIRIFDGCGFVLFGLLAVYAGLIDTGFGPVRAALVLETGFLLTSVWSLAVRHPFTRDYGWLQDCRVPDVVSRAHLLLTSFWTAAYAVLAAISALSAVYNWIDASRASVLGLVVFASMLTFTWQFGAYIDRHGGRIPLFGAPHPGGR